MCVHWIRTLDGEYKSSLITIFEARCRVLSCLGSTLWSKTALPFSLPLGGSQCLSIDSASLKGVNGVLDSFLHEKLQELFLADVPIRVAVNFSEDALDAVVGLLAL